MASLTIPIVARIQRKLESLLRIQHRRGRWGRARVLLLFASCGGLFLLVGVLLQSVLLGYGATKRGGLLGKIVDTSLRQILFHYETQRHRDRFQTAMGYPLPNDLLSTNQVGVPVLIHAWLAETLLGAKQRTDAVAAAFGYVNNRTSRNQTQQQQHSVSEECLSSHMLVWPLMIHPNFGDWYRPLEWNDSYNFSQVALANDAPTAIFQNFTKVVFDDEQIRSVLSSVEQSVWDDSLDKIPTHAFSFNAEQLQQHERIQMFGMAAVYLWGGIFVAPDIRTTEHLEHQAPKLRPWLEAMRNNNNSPSTTATKNTDNSTHSCQPQQGLFLQTLNMREITVMSASPKHPMLKCFLRELLVTRQTVSDLALALHLLSSFDFQWDPSCELQCCQQLQNKQQRSNKENNHNKNNQLDTFSNMEQSNGPAVGKLSPRFHVRVTDDATTSLTVTKRRCSDRLKQQRCSAGWLCNRCLRLPFYGSLHACRFLCRSCHERIVCDTSEARRRWKSVTVQVLVQEKRNQTNQRRIPNIIHQTWFETMSTMRYPHMQRLQNSWKASGWEYRFYTNADCQLFIKQNYPKRFSDVYEAIIPGAFKADLFRLLVLFKEGGIYADIDVKLDIDLDTFVTRDLSFFVPRDVAQDYWPDSNYCLWNGLMGSAPGNHILAMAIEDVMTTVLNRIDYYDIEGSLCSQNRIVEIWKLRTFPILALTGPCALGMSVNAALGHANVLRGFGVGWLRSNITSTDYSTRNETLNQPHFWGDALILLADRYDTGELRFSDIDRNLLVASTNQDRIAVSPIIQSSDAAGQSTKTPVHYSKSESDIVGEYGTYKDDQTANERVRLRIVHEFV